MAEQLTPRTLDLEVQGLSLARCVFSLARNFTPLCLSLPWCIMGTGNRLASHPGRSSNTPRHALCYGNQYKLWPFGPLARVFLFLFFLQISLVD